MKLASLLNNRPDGELVVVSRDLTRMVRVREIVPTLQAALEDWSRVKPLLEAKYESLTSSAVGEAFDPKLAASPLPRAYRWCDASVFPAHYERLMGKWLKRTPDPRYYKEPWIYQGSSDGFLAPNEPIACASEEWGIDYEGEIAVVTDEVPYGVAEKDAGSHIALVMLVNDVSLRNLIPDEMTKEFGFLQSKPAAAFSPVAVTPDELGEHWRDYRVHMRLRSFVNGDMFGDPEAGEMVHGFDKLIYHTAKSCSLGAGSILGSGTVANADEARGVSCIAERRMIENDRLGSPKTPYFKYGDRVKLEMLNKAGQSIFGAIEQEVVPVHK
jgi:fumarylacetoacetate (FAA) hydrolase